MEGVATCSHQDRKRRPSRKRSVEDKGKHTATKHRRTECQRQDGLSRSSRLGGSISDPLNLEGLPDDFECPTCAPSPSDGCRMPGDQPSPLPSQFQGDPLNLEEKVADYSKVVAKCQHHGLDGRKRKEEEGGVKKHRRVRGRSKSHSESSEDVNQASASSFNPKVAAYRYGNYDKYYGYRNPGAFQEDPRLKLLQRPWFEGKLCLDIGSNAGHLTVAIAKNFAPCRITGIEIDSKLVRVAWKNLHRYFLPAVAPDGRPFPKSLVMSCGPLVPHSSNEVAASSGRDSREFPHNVEFVEVSDPP